MSSRFFIIPGNHLPAFITAVYLDKNVTTQYTLSSDPISFPQHCYFRILTCCYIYQCTIPFYWWVISNAVWFSICPFACLSFWLSLLLSNLFSLISNFCWFSWNLLRQLQSWTVLHPFLLLSVDNCPLDLPIFPLLPGLAGSFYWESHETHIEPISIFV